MDRSITLQYLFCKFASVEFDDGGTRSAVYATKGDIS